MRLTPRARRFWLTAHVAVSVGWIGAVAAYLVLDIQVATTDDPLLLRSALLAMASVTWWAIIPLAFASLATGLLMSLGTKWGLFRHWWVVVSLVLTLFAIAVLLVETQTINHYAALASDTATPDERLQAIPGTLVHSIGGLIMLLGILVLNTYKPKGLTRYGWRKKRQERGGTGR